MTTRVCGICGQPPTDDFDVGEIYWHVECYTEGKFEAHVLPRVNTKLESRFKSDQARLAAFLEQRSKLSREDAVKIAVQNVLATDPDAITDPEIMQKKVADTFHRIVGDKS